MIVRLTALLGSVWLLANLGPLGWFLLTLTVCFAVLALLVAWPLALLGVAGWSVWRLSVLARGRWGL